jgi:hypothetical protein
VRRGIGVGKEMRVLSIEGVADDYVAGFQYRDDAERFLAARDWRSSRWNWRRTRHD